MFEFYLFRIKVYLSQQYGLFENQGRRGVLQEALEEKPSAELRKGYVWHVGNLAHVEANGLYFALGRTTRALIERFDEEQGNFVEENFETSPYTHVFLDFHYQVLVLAKKTRLAPTPKGIATQLEKLLNASRAVEIAHARVEISQINDPEDFVEHIRNAYAVTRFGMEFGHPNPWDANEDFQKPMQKLLSRTSGFRGSTTIQGEDLDRDALEKLVRATASTGNDAQATIKMSPRGKAKRKRLKGNAAVIAHDEIASGEQRRGLLDVVRAYYERIRQQLKDD